jgi:hypothetical protein
MSLATLQCVRGATVCIPMLCRGSPPADLEPYQVSGLGVQLVPTSVTMSVECPSAQNKAWQGQVLAHLGMSPGL